MNTKILISIAVLCMAQLSCARIIRRDATEAATTPSPAEVFFQGLGELFTKAKDEVERLESRFLEVVGVENREQLTQVVQNKTGDYVLTLQGLLGDLQAEGQKQAGQVQELVTSATARFQESVKKLQDQNPELTQQAQQYKENVAKELEKIVGEAKNLANTISTNNVEVSENVNKVISNIVQQTSLTTRELLDKVEKSLQQPQPAAAA